MLLHTCVLMCSSQGLAGPAANSELVLYEFLNVITRVSFYRLNPEYGELTMEHQDTLLPVPQCLDRTLRECILPKAHRDDAAEFRAKAMQQPEVQAAAIPIQAPPGPQDARVAA